MNLADKIKEMADEGVSITFEPWMTQMRVTLEITTGGLRHRQTHVVHRDHYVSEDRLVSLINWQEEQLLKMI